MDLRPGVRASGRGASWRHACHAWVLLPLLLGGVARCGGEVVPIGRLVDGGVGEGGTPGAQDGGRPIPDLGQVPDGDPAPCAPDRCGPVLTFAKICPGSDFVPERRCLPSATGECSWQFGACPSVDASEPGACVISGCSQEICGETEKASTCEFRDEYACYAAAECRRNAAGVCGWQATPAFQACIDALGRTDAGADATPGSAVCRADGRAGCALGFYCQFAPEDACGRLGSEGLCRSKTEPCSTLVVIQQVCGCDGKTYRDSCVANAAGVPVDHEGACSVAGKACGGLGGGSCAADQFCQYELAAQCGHADQTGVCQSRPQVCTADERPVCGCDGQTWSNACVAARAGVSVLAAGACASTANRCGGIAGLGCPEGEFCRFEPSTRCGAGDALGVCQKKGAPCTDVSSVVCGCDGKWYPSACAAESAGVSYQTEAACR